MAAMKKADHPPTCRVCEGTGFEPGPPIVSIVNGESYEYTTVQPCTHHWANDEPILFAEIEV